jgi:biopolymer transport protein ExbD
MPIRPGFLRIYLMAAFCQVSFFCYAQQTAPTETSKTVTEKKDLIINTKMDTLSVIFQNTLIPIRSFSQLDSFIRGNLIGMAKPRVEIRGYPGDTYENFDKVIAILKKNKITDFSFSMAPAAP